MEPTTSDRCEPVDLRQRPSATSVPLVCKQVVSSSPSMLGGSNHVTATTARPGICRIRPI